MNEAAGPAEPTAGEPLPAPAAEPAAISSVEPIAPAPAAPIVYVGGQPESARPRLPRGIVAAVFVGIFLLVAAGGSGFWLLNTTRQVSFRPAAGSTAEPAVTKAFVDALHRGDPTGMRAQVTKACLADQSSSLCFGPEADSRFQQSMAHRKVDLTFLRRYDGKLGTVVLYDLLVHDTSTGEQVEWILTLRLSADGHIDRAVTS
ncbi:MAG: hypothetical protein E6J01_02335 [Chloroflexi bacterium]|nr:MAG: hypothetical protein E6J01_02335 [Chloroflexota bacterium]